MEEITSGWIVKIILSANGPVLYIYMDNYLSQRDFSSQEWQFTDVQERATTFTNSDAFTVLDAIEEKFYGVAGAFTDVDEVERTVKTEVKVKAKK